MTKLAFKEAEEPEIKLPTFIGSWRKQVKVNVTQSCPAVCDPMDYTVHGILQARLQQYVNCDLPDVQPGFRKGGGTRDQIANIR